MRSTSKSVGLQGCAQVDFLVLFIMPILGSLVATEILGSTKTMAHAYPASITGLNIRLSHLILT